MIRMLITEEEVGELLAGVERCERCPGAVFLVAEHPHEEARGVFRVRFSHMPGCTRKKAERPLKAV